MRPPSLALPRSLRTLRGATALLVLAALLAGPMPVAVAQSGAVVGTAFADLDRDGVRQPAELPWAGHRLHLFDADGAFAATTTTAADGTYRFDGIPAGEHTVAYAPASWWEVRDDWVPTTTGSLQPRVGVVVDGEARADFGWRPISRSTDLAAPLSRAGGDGDPVVASYTDAVDAAEVLAALRSGALIGAEAPGTTIRFGYGSSSACSSSIVRRDGIATSVTSACQVSYASWLDGGDRTLFHEYAHAWAAHHANLSQQDPTLAGYLQVRGLAEDERLDTSHAWSRHELIAEDARQLLGSPTARAGGQMNPAIPPAAAVEGLAAYLATTFTTPVGGDPEPEPEPQPDPEPDPVAAVVHVAELSGTAVALRRDWRAEVVLRVADDLGAPVAGARATLTWTPSKGGSGTLSCTTDAAGRCAVGTAVKGSAAWVRIDLAQLAADLPHDPAGDAVATSVVVARP